MGSLADMEVLDREGGPALLVEVKSKLGTSREWAISMRRNLAAHGSLPPSKLFLVATPDQFYLWHGKTASVERAAPDLTFDPSSVLEPYYEQARLRPGELAETSFELIVGSWLSELIHGHGKARLPDEVASSVVGKELIQAIRGGRLERQ